MIRYKQLKRHPLIRPLCIVLSSILQPTNFANAELGNPYGQFSASRFKAMWQLAFILFLLSYLFAIPIRLILMHIVPKAFFFQDTLPTLLLDIAWPIAIVVCACTFLGAWYGRAFGISSALGGGLWAGVGIHTNIEYNGYIVILSTTLAMLGLIWGIALASARDIKNDNRLPAAIGHFVGILSGTPLGIFAGLLAGYGGGFLTYIVVQNDLHWNLDFTKTSGGVVGSIMGFLLAGCLAIGAVAVVRGSLRTKIGVQRGLSTGIAFCLTGGAIVGGTISLFISYQGFQAIHASFTNILVPNLPAAAAAAFFFMAGYYRLPLYPFSSLSSMIACWASKKNPPKVFKYLHCSAIYWDECIFPRLPGLQVMLYIAVTQNPKRAFDEIEFIIKQRPTQAWQVHQATLEWLLRKVEIYKNLDQMQQIAPLVKPFLLPDANYLNQEWLAPLIHLNNASLEVQSYLVSSERTSRIEALQRMLEHLKRMQQDIAFNNERQNNRFKIFAKMWQKQAGDILETLKKDTLKTNTNLREKQTRATLKTTKKEVSATEIIDDPYIIGPALRTGDPRFVGRQNIIEKLKTTFALDRSIALRYSAFSLKGERRMGKTSMLNQLSILLGTNCFSITLNLQSPSVRATLAEFLGNIAKEIYTTMATRSPNFTVTVPKLDYRKLERVAKENEQQAYGIFEEWLENIEAILQKDDQKILLAFDEFEKLGEKAAHINLKLLLDWFRSVTESHPRLGLLFSGVKSPAEMGWASYFVHVETLPVSFLSPLEARKLILTPLSINGLPASAIFNDEVINDIIRVTACHPFLVQAICSKLVDILNARDCKSAHLQDVSIAVDGLLENWDNFFVDLWDRTDEEQRSCLKAFVSIGRATTLQIAQYTHLDEKVAHQVIKKLRERDLITVNKGHTYAITVPILSNWVERRIMEEE